MSATSDSTATILTSNGRGAIAVIVVDGPNAISLVERYFHPRGRKKFASQPTNTIVYGRWGEGPGEDVIVCRRAADSVEVHCHGGHAAVRRIMDDLISAGAREQPWNVWANRGETTQIRCAARLALAQTATLHTAAKLLDQYHGALEETIANIRQRIAGAQSPIDDGKLATALNQIETLLSRGQLGMHLTQPWRVVIAGPPNVGKSSLVNALLGYQRALVFDMPGTTRDAVTAQTALDGWPIAVTDTAGWRTSHDALETAGIEIAKQHAQRADCLALAFDASQPWTAENDRLIDQWRPAILVQNKCDLAPGDNFRGTRRDTSSPRHSENIDILKTSALTGAGIETLASRIVQTLVPLTLESGIAVPFTTGQIEQLVAARNALQTGDASSAIAHLTAMLA